MELVSQGRALAEELDWEEGLSDALSLLGLVRTDLGDRGGLEDLERGVEIGSEYGCLWLPAARV